jgi:hypothetical protein
MNKKLISILIILAILVGSGSFLYTQWNYYVCISRVYVESISHLEGFGQSEAELFFKIGGYKTASHSVEEGQSNLNFCVRTSENPVYVSVHEEDLFDDDFLGGFYVYNGDKSSVLVDNDNVQVYYYTK